jgi:hypothetical protein
MFKSRVHWNLPYRKKNWFKKYNIGLVGFTSLFLIQNFMFLHGLFAKYIFNYLDTWCLPLFLNGNIRKCTLDA